MPLYFSVEKFTALLEARGWRVEDLASASGLSYIQLIKVRRGKAQPSARALGAIASALEIEPGDLYADDGKTRGRMPPGPPPPPMSPETRAKLSLLLDLSGNDQPVSCPECSTRYNAHTLTGCPVCEGARTG